MPIAKRIRRPLAGLAAGLVATALALSAAPLPAAPLGSAFTYQGALDSGGTPANGPYDFEFRIFDDPVAVLPLGPPVLRDDVGLTAGVFSVDLDFGTAAFNGQARWLEIAVRPGTSIGAYTPLLPRQRIAPAPYALTAASVPAGAIAATEINAAQVQRRINAACAVGSALRAVAQDGVPTCQLDDTGAAQLAAHAAQADAHGPLLWTAPNASAIQTLRDAVRINSSVDSGATLYVNDAGATGPALLLANAVSSEGDIAVVAGDALQVGSWDIATAAYTNHLQIDSTGRVGVANSLGIGTFSPASALVVQGDDVVAQIRDDSTDNSADAARLELLERSGGAFNAGGFVQWDGSANRLYVGTISSGTRANLLVLDRGSQSVGIGTQTLDNSYALSVNGSIRSKEIVVESGWSDYVFAPDYRLASLAEVERHIEAHGHLPDVPSADAIAAGGLPLGDMQATLMRKIEELTLHLIAMEKRLDALAADKRALEQALAEAAGDTR
jgi:hypothetical protein